MLNVRAHAAALARAIPDALIIEHLGTRGVFIHRAMASVSLPEFTVCRGFILGDEVDAPTQVPHMSEEDTVLANVRALVRYRDTLVEAGLEIARGPLRTLITLSQSPEPESLHVAMWVY